MNNVASISDPKKVRAEQAIQFAEAMGKRGQYNPTTSRLFKTALQRFLEILADDEDKSAAAVLDHLDDLCDRWARLNNADPGTAKQYKARARLLLTDFVGYLSDPTAFKGRGNSAGSGGAKPKRPEAAAKQKSAQSKRDEASDTSGSSGPRLTGSTPPVDQPMRSYPLGEGREIEFRLPPTGIRWPEVAKFSLHLLTMATDFDPTVPEQARMFAIVKRGPAD